MNIQRLLERIKQLGLHRSVREMLWAVWELIEAHNMLVKDQQNPLLSPEQLDDIEGALRFVIASPKGFEDGAITVAMRALEELHGKWNAALSYHAIYIISQPQEHGPRTVYLALEKAVDAECPITREAVDRLREKDAHCYSFALRPFEKVLVEQERRRELAEREINFDEAAAEARAPVYHPSTWGD